MRDRQAIADEPNSQKIILKKSEKRVAYEEAVAAMKNEVDAVRRREMPEKLWFLEHPRLYTAGTSAKARDLLNPNNLPVYHAGRGGQWTYHGPGQRIVYVMLDLQHAHGPTPPRDIRAFVSSLEHWIIAALDALGIRGRTVAGRIGVWVDDPLSGEEVKIAALGIRLSHWITWHGISINVDPCLDDFDGIIPCGLKDHGVTSLTRFNPELAMPDLDHALVSQWPQFFGDTTFVEDRSVTS